MIDSNMPAATTTSTATLFAQAVAHHQAGRLIDAETAYGQILARDGSHVGALSNLAALHLQRGRYDDAIRLIERSLACRPDQPNAHNNLGMAWHRRKRLEQALASYDRALALKSDFPEAHNNRGNVLYDLGRMQEALASFEHALALRPDYAEAYNNRGNALRRLERPEEALTSYDRAIALVPHFAQAHNNRGNVLQDLKRHEEALASYDRALALQPGYAEVYNHRGNTLRALARAEEALASYDRALALVPDFAEAHTNRAKALRDLRRLPEALESCERALGLKPDWASAHLVRGEVLRDLGQHEEALQSLTKAIAIEPDLQYAAGNWLHTKMQNCDWQQLDIAYRKVLDAVDQGNKASFPFPLLATPAGPARQQRCARIYTNDRYPEHATPVWQGERYAHGRLRIGYVSADFCNHPTSHLIARLIESHDRTRFETVGFYVGFPSQDAWHQRLKRAFDHFVDVENRSDAEIAALVRELEIDIAVDLNGHTGKGRMGVFARRAAPLQVAYLGYPGTCGASYIDYLIADSTVVPEEHRRYYDEKVVLLPHSYQVNDCTKKIANRSFSRAELGLPDRAFVFCCFNGCYKITPDVFDVWMRLLRTVEGSVLWLFSTNAVATKNLTREARERGVAPERLVFADYVPLADHLARLRQADLFLDTFYCNAHTTASDALWAGVPVLTCRGDTFAGRVAASLLNAIGLPELVARDAEEYEALALALAQQPVQLAAVRENLARNRSTQPLFDTLRFTRGLENAYMQMYERQQAGLAPDHIVIVP